jgi:tetratricopeptide (TPR) repeat protein
MRFLNSRSILNARRMIRSAAPYEAERNYVAAAKVCARAVAALRRERSSREIDIALHRALHTFGRVRLAQGLYSEAESLLKESLDLARRRLGPNHLKVVWALNELATCYKHMARYREAGELYQRALSIAESAPGPNHPEVATIYRNLGDLEHAAGNPERGEPFARRALRMHVRTLGPEHPAVAADQASLAALLDQQRKYDEAMCLYGRALSIFERVHGPEHPDVAVILNNLAAIYAMKGRGEEAERFYRRALGLKRKLLGNNHPDIAVTLNNLAMLLKVQRKYSQAQLVFIRAIRIFEKYYGTEHPKVAACLQNYSGLLQKMKLTDEARRLKRQSRSILSRVEQLRGGGPAVTATINPAFSCFHLSVRESRIHRWGVYAGEYIPPRRKVIEYTGKRISLRAARRRGGGSLDYLFRLDGSTVIDGTVGGSGAEYINHSCDPNLGTRRIRGHICYFSIRPIALGEELTVD